VELLIASVAVVLIVSALCSLSEAALYSVTPAYVRHLDESGATSGRLLMHLKERIGRPITAILILNTVANTAGAVVAGAQARYVFGASAIVWFSSVFTVAVLVLAEIVPKVLGVTYSRSVARSIAWPLELLVRVLSPVVWLTEHFSALVAVRGEPVAPESEVHRLADLSAEEGSILPTEATLVKNVLKLDDVRTRDIMTPRTVVFRKPDDLTVRDMSPDAWTLPHARIPIHEAKDSDHWTGVVLRRDILAALARDEFAVTLKSLAKSLLVVPDTMRGHELLSQFLRRRRHLFGVIDEYGNIVGIVTLEDVLEELIGEEIVDETDKVVDTREAARKKSEQQFGETIRDGESG
jgi:CBS domain containing-hemolysin-like protein